MPVGFAARTKVCSCFFVATGEGRGGSQAGRQEGRMRGQGGEGGRRGLKNKCFRERRKERENERPTHPQNSRGIRQCSSRAWDAISGRTRVDSMRFLAAPAQRRRGCARGSCVELMREALSTLPSGLPMIGRTGAFRLWHQHRIGPWVRPLRPETVKIGGPVDMRYSISTQLLVSRRHR